ncbi:MBL fold metallo-hydrolase [Candidatus Woesebacteria bacterium]|nr:MBL fold metallo-hydrolase [Candidatus Woesebacteria bacterium]
MKAWKYLIGFLFLASVSVWLAAFSAYDRNLHLVACDVGQGDAILAVYGDIQILTDGGPGNSVLTCLQKYMPFWDREIELVVLTHPQEDHYYGLVEVFKRYKVDTFLTNDFSPSTQGLKALESAVGGAMARVVKPESGTRLRLGMIYLDMVHPEQGVFSNDLNDISIVTILSLGNFEAILTGDIGPKAAAQILAKTPLKDVDYIKVPHHGSKNGLTHEFLEAVRPEIAVISVGSRNSYGHPHQEVLEMLENSGVKVLRTDEEGDVEVVSDGKKWWLEK